MDLHKSGSSLGTIYNFYINICHHTSQEEDGFCVAEMMLHHKALISILQKAEKVCVAYKSASVPPVLSGGMEQNYSKLF